jgi:hypothetical protein
LTSVLQSKAEFGQVVVALDAEHGAARLPVNAGVQRAYPTVGAGLDAGAERRGSPLACAPALADARAEVGAGKVLAARRAAGAEQHGKDQQQPFHPILPF